MCWPGGQEGRQEPGVIILVSIFEFDKTILAVTIISLSSQYLSLLNKHLNLPKKPEASEWLGGQVRQWLDPGPKHCLTCTPKLNS